MKKKILYLLIFVFVVIQFFRIDKTTKPLDLSKDFSSVSNAPSDVISIIKTSCYDCHSYETVYPWYSNIAPISWFLKSDINKGREHLNFSEWGNYSDNKKLSLCEEISEEIKTDEMPLNIYTFFHAEAKLSSEKKSILINWFSKMKKQRVNNN